MSTEEPTEDQEQRGWSDVAVGVASLPIIALLYLETRGFQVVDWAPLGMAFWPRVLLGFWLVLSVFLIIQGLRRSSGAAPLELAAFLPVLLGVLFLLAVPTFGLLIPLGIIVTVFSFLRNAERDRKATMAALATGAVTVFAIYLLFGVLLGVQLPGPEFGG